jgi:predicted PurR-regulated permease PerM
MSSELIVQRLERIEFLLICMVVLQLVWMIICGVGLLSVRKKVSNLTSEISATINNMHDRLVEIKSVMDAVQTIWSATSGGAVSLLSSAASAASSLRSRLSSKP